MKHSFIFSLAFLSFCLQLSVPGELAPQTAAPAASTNQTPAGLTPPAPQLCVACVRAHMEFLASDALRGRGSATTEELVAATYVASQLRAYGIAPAGDDGGYLQRAALLQPKFTAPPQVTFAK